MVPVLLLYVSLALPHASGLSAAASNSAIAEAASIWAPHGVVVRDAKGEVIAELSDYLGIQTNNFAEYSGLLAALDYAVREKQLSLKVLSDSELLVKQMKGQYRVKSPGLLELYDRARALVRKLEHFSIEHVLRQYNREADALVNQVLDSRKGIR